MISLPMKVASLVLFAFLISATISGQIRFAVQGGLNVSTLVERNQDHDHARNIYLSGFNMGLTAEYGLNGHLSLLSSLVLETKGTKASYRLDTFSADFKTNLLYFDIPVLIRANLKAGECRFYVEGGPYAGVGLKGKGIVDTGDIRNSRDVRWGSSRDDDFKRIDFGAMAGAGMVWNRFGIEGTFIYGLANIYPVRDVDYDIQHRVFGARLVYFFGVAKQ